VFTPVTVQQNWVHPPEAQREPDGQFDGVRTTCEYAEPGRRT
jgi:hypothetical protein